MKALKTHKAILASAAFGILAACSQTPRSPDVSANIRKALEQAGLKSVSVRDDRVNGVVTLTGQVPSDGNKQQAESIAKSMSAGQVVADQIAVVPTGKGSAAREINADLDAGISKNLDAALIQNGMKDGVRFTVKNEVVTLTGQVDSEARRAQVQQIATQVPNVAQVVNEVQVKNQKATSSE